MLQVQSGGRLPVLKTLSGWQLIGLRDQPEQADLCTTRKL